MTTLLRPVRRETLSQVRERGKLRPIIVELSTTCCRVRLKSQRRAFTITYDQLFNLGARNAAEELRRERAEKRAAKRKERNA